MDAVFLYAAAANQMVMERRMNEISNNIANVNTTAFKKQVPVFAGLHAPFAKVHSLGGSQDGTGNISLLPIPVFPVIDELVTNFEEGAIQVTGNPLDVAIEGKGFFQIQTAGGIRYSRNGTFAISPEKQLVTDNGNPVLGSGGPIALPPGIVTIDPTGKISVQGPDGGPPIEIGSIALVDIPAKTFLQKIGNNLFTLMEGGEAVPIEEGKGRVRQGALESSNVNPVAEMVAMISAIRQYEAAQKAIQTADDIDIKNINKIGQLQG